MSSKKSGGSLKGKELQSTLRELYQVAKEHILKVKGELKKSEEQYEVQKVTTQKKDLEYKELLAKRDQLDLIIKGLDEKLIDIEKGSSDVSKQIKGIQEEQERAKKSSEWLSCQASEKVKTVENERKAIKTNTQEKIKSYNDTLEKVKEENLQLMTKIEEIEGKIKEMRISLLEIQNLNGRKNDELIKESNEMRKFLSEI